MLSPTRALSLKWWGVVPHHGLMTCNPHPLYLKIMKITGTSTARYATWYFLEDYRVLFDVGDGAAAALGPKCQKVQHVFLSHADRDHIGGLLQFNHLGARDSKPLHFYYPKDSSSFPAMKEFIEHFDASIAKSIWTPVEAGMRIDIGKRHLVEIGENYHIAIASGNTCLLYTSDAADD